MSKFGAVRLRNSDGTVHADPLDGKLPVQVGNFPLPTTISSALVTVTTATTRVQFATTTAKSITVKAAAANTGIIYVGNSTVAASNGFPLASGELISIDISNTDAVWVDSSVSGETCNWFSVN